MMRFLLWGCTLMLILVVGSLVFVVNKVEKQFEQIEEREGALLKMHCPFVLEEDRKYLAEKISWILGNRQSITHVLDVLNDTQFMKTTICPQFRNMSFEVGDQVYGYHQETETVKRKYYNTIAFDISAEITRPKPKLVVKKQLDVKKEVGIAPRRPRKVIKPQVEKQQVVIKEPQQFRPTF